MRGADPVAAGRGHTRPPLGWPAAGPRRGGPRGAGPGPPRRRRLAPATEAGGGGWGRAAAYAAAPLGSGPGASRGLRRGGDGGDRRARGGQAAAPAGSRAVRASNAAAAAASGFMAKTPAPLPLPPPPPPRTEVPVTRQLGNVRNMGAGAPPQPCVTFRRLRPRPESRGTNMSAPVAAAILEAPPEPGRRHAGPHPPSPSLSSSSSKSGEMEPRELRGLGHPAALAPRAHRGSCSELRLRLQQHAPLIAFSSLVSANFILWLLDTITMESFLITVLG